jgi:hypothetical protein
MADVSEAMAFLDIGHRPINYWTLSSIEKGRVA